MNKYHFKYLNSKNIQDWLEVSNNSSERWNTFSLDELIVQ